MYGKNKRNGKRLSGNLGRCGQTNIWKIGVKTKPSHLSHSTYIAQLIESKTIIEKYGDSSLFGGYFGNEFYFTFSFVKSLRSSSSLAGPSFCFLFQRRLLLAWCFHFSCKSGLCPIFPISFPLKQTSVLYYNYQSRFLILLVPTSTVKESKASQDGTTTHTT